ncbi:heparinase II/III domain-containing protein [Kribbella sp. CA-293567]|uniref:heparinase II/III domain-containing protein n=1 Tax=Kribbella sp. CA-293567 TaxID=3002436 RepID=UPI0022DE78B6|nr:heparinase II/III family protein [Kribbella sp. CA-293567]WBQ04326.1 heparinase II/III family protein [Kribbella sp. CA-293567]
MPRRRLWLPLLTAGAVVVVIALITVILSPQTAWGPRATQPPKAGAKAIPSATKPTTADRPGQVKAAKYECPKYSGIDGPNPVARIHQDTFQWGVHPAYQVGDGKGDINWRANPYNQPSWYMWLHSLRWLGQGIEAGRAGDKKALARVTTIIRDWVTDNPYDWKGDVGAHEATMHRTNVLICARQAVLSGSKARTLPPGYAWLDKALLDHARFMEINWGGVGNHGTDESIALFGIGCTLGRQPLKQLAERRLSRAINESIDEQGSTNEQSTAYAIFNYTLWGRAIKALQDCGAEPSPSVKGRRAALATWIAMASDSFGRVHQLGDSERVRTPTIFPGTLMLYPGTLGEQGRPPAERVGIYDAGYVFGRTGWGEQRPFAQESTYSIRFGPARTLHGHDDHMSITYTSHGREILVDGGHPGYQVDKWRNWAKSESAHNVLSSPLMAGRPTETKLVRSRIEPTAEFYHLSDSPGPGMSRERSILVLKDPDLILALDRATSEQSQDFQAQWHLPIGQQATVSSPTTVVAHNPRDKVKTVLLQIPYQQALPGDAITVTHGQEDPVQGWHYPTTTTRQAAPVVSFNRSGKSATVLSVIVPADHRAAVSYRTRTTGSTMFVDLTVGALRTTVAVREDGHLSRVK